MNKRTPTVCFFSHFRFIPGTVEPRTLYNYNNLMFHMLGHLTQTISGEEWEELIQRRIFDEVGMKDTALNYLVDKNAINLAKPYKLYNGELREVDLDIHVSWMKAAGGAGEHARGMKRFLEQVLWFSVISSILNWTTWKTHILNILSCYHATSSTKLFCMTIVSATFGQS